MFSCFSKFQDILLLSVRKQEVKKGKAMGMYDTINDEQVKVFTVPVGYGDNIRLTGGSLLYFGNGDDVPYKTWWYDYTDNFNIIDEYAHAVNPNEPVIVHKIREGKVAGTLSWVDVSPADFYGVGLCVSYVGDILSIRTYAEAEMFLRNSADFRAIAEAKRAKAYKFLEEIPRIMRGTAEEEKKDEAAAERIMEYEKMKDACEKELEPYRRVLISPFMMEDKYEKEHMLGEILDLIIDNIKFIGQMEKEGSRSLSGLIPHLSENMKVWKRMTADSPEVFHSFMKVCGVSKEEVKAVTDEGRRILRKYDAASE